MTIGALIRELRSLLGWSQGRLAAALCDASKHATVTREDVSRWESGKRTPGPFWLRHLAAVLDVPLAVLEGPELHRRKFISSVAATLIAPIVASDLIETGYAAALTGGRPSVEAWQATIDRYGQDYMTFGAAEMQQRVSGDLVILQQQLDGPALWAIASRLMTVYGKTIPGADGAKAVRWYRMAATAADRSEDATSRVWVRGRAAIALGYEGACLPIAASFADQALAISDKPSLGALNALMAKAHVAAIRGDKHGALRLLDDSRRVFDVAASDGGERSDFAVPEWRMAVFCSLLLARLGEEHGAIAEQERAVRTLPATLPRFATHLELHRGLMMARAGDLTGGVAYAREALAKLPPERHSLTLRMLLSEIESARSA